MGCDSRLQRHAGICSDEGALLRGAAGTSPAGSADGCSRRRRVRITAGQRGRGRWQGVKRGNSHAGVFLDTIADDVVEFRASRSAATPLARQAGETGRPGEKRPVTVATAVRAFSLSRPRATVAAIVSAIAAWSTRELAGVTARRGRFNSGGRYHQRTRRTHCSSERGRCTAHDLRRAFPPQCWPTLPERPNARCHALPDARRDAPAQGRHRRPGPWRRSSPDRRLREVPSGEVPRRP